MENGGLSDKFGELSIDNAKDNSLFQVMKAVEAAEATIRQQVIFLILFLFLCKNLYLSMMIKYCEVNLL